MFFCEKSAQRIPNLKKTAQPIFQISNKIAQSGHPDREAEHVQVQVDQIELLFTLGRFFKITEVSQKYGLLLSMGKVLF
jgi:hypothetical protein